MGYPVAYNTSGAVSGSLDRGNINVFISSSVTSTFQGKTFGPALDVPASGMLIIGDNGSTPLFWVINDLNDTASVLDTINRLPDRISETPFTDTGSALSYLGSSGNYFPLSSNESIPQIVTDGLVLNLDAGLLASYPTTGTAWYDLSGNTNNGTLTNGPTFSSANGGSIVSDGVDDYLDFYAPGLGNTATVEMWCKIGSGYSGKMFFGWLRYDVWCNGGSIGYNTSSGDVYGISQATVNSLGIVGQWAHYVFEMRSDVSYTNNKIYINSVNQTLSQQYGGENSSTRSFNNGYGRIALWRAGGTYHMPMNCAAFKVYNRALTTSEVLQNYNAQKKRFGL